VSGLSGCLRGSLHATLASRFATITAGITDRLAAVEKSISDGRGESAYADPQIAAIMQEVNALRHALAVKNGYGLGMREMWGYMLGAIGALALLWKASGH
jgi:hypothetical protein